MLDVVHTTCRGIAFRYAHRLEPGDPWFQAEHVETIDGSVPIAGDEMICGSCGFPTGHDLEFT